MPIFLLLTLIIGLLRFHKSQDHTLNLMVNMHYHCITEKKYKSTNWKTSCTFSQVLSNVSNLSNRKCHMPGKHWYVHGVFLPVLGHRRAILYFKVV